MTDGERLVALLGEIGNISKAVARIEVDRKADVARLDESIAKTRAFVGSQTDDLHTRLNAISNDVIRIETLIIKRNGNGSKPVAVRAKQGGLVVAAGACLYAIAEWVRMLTAAGVQ